LIGILLLLIPIGVHAWPYGKPRVTLTNLGPAVQGLNGIITSLDYSQDGSKLAITQKLKEREWALRIVDANNDENGKILKVAAGQSRFRPVFVSNGSSILLTGDQGQGLRLLKVQTETGQTEVLASQGIQPLGEGNPWSEISRRFLYVSKGASGYRLNALDPVTRNVRVLLETTQQILSPSWTRNADQVAYVRATAKNTGVYVLDLATQKQTLLVANDPNAKEEELFRPEAQEAVKNVPFLKRLFAKKEPHILLLNAVLPAPDGFRLLYRAEKGKDSSLWTILPDGTKQSCLYESKGTLDQLAWLKDGHTVFFQETQNRFGFRAPLVNIRVLDVELGKMSNLLPPIVSCQAPAVSPDGVKVAFAGRSGLWYPSQGHLGIWVAVLR